MLPTNARTELTPPAPTFLQRRWDPQSHVGRHLTVGSLVALLALVLFGFLTADVLHHGEITVLDGRVDNGLREASWNTQKGNKLCTNLSELGSTHMMGWLAVLTTVVLFLSGHRMLACIFALMMVTGGALDVGLKNLFHVGRPPLELAASAKAKAGIAAGTWGFPSGHSLGSMLGYGLLAYLAIRYLIQRARARTFMVVFAAGTIALIGFSRLYVHAHYLSQVLGGFLFGIFLLSVAIMLMETWRLYQARRSLASGPDEVPVGQRELSVASAWRADGQ